MELFNPNFGVYFLYLTLITSIFFLTGGFISRFVYKDKYVHFRIFLNLIIGYLFWIVLTAFYFTKGNSVFLIIPIGILFFIVDLLSINILLSITLYQKKIKHTISFK